jgi:hypothetical protein
LAFRHVIASKPPLSQTLRKFKHFCCQISLLSTPTVCCFELKPERGLTVSKLRLFRRECGRVDLVVKPQIEKTVVLLTQYCQLGESSHPAYLSAK